VRDDHIEITTHQALVREFYADRAEGDYPTLVNARFKGAPLAQALSTLSRQGELNILLDPQAGDAADKPLSADLRNVPVDTALRLLADMAGLEMVRLDNVYYVTTPQKASAWRERLRKERPPAPPRQPLGMVEAAAEPSPDSRVRSPGALLPSPSRLQNARAGCL